MRFRTNVRHLGVFFYSDLTCHQFNYTLSSKAKAYSQNQGITTVLNMNDGKDITASHPTVVITFQSEPTWWFPLLSDLLSSNG